MESANGDDSNTDIQMILEELKLIESKIQQFDSQLHSITQFGLPLLFTIVSVAMFLYDRNRVLAGLVLILGGWIMGTVGFIARKNARYLRAMSDLSYELEKKLEFKITHTIKETRKTQFNCLEDKIFDPKWYSLFKYLLFIAGLWIIARAWG
ncbi:hypothetical protein [Thermococcus sp. MAR1]|uniref:hypothetical protein n=1 Tax=Thermococcus sp. MAR1 TaxID=1638263 RepID=UPI00143AB4A2|nr:hypothetical protein [Thermococcus sp. MAR1]NJE11465.1 hypothetical protein [Thermococcus sp. MAR1]